MLTAFEADTLLVRAHGNAQSNTVHIEKPPRAGIPSPKVDIGIHHTVQSPHINRRAYPAIRLQLLKVYRFGDNVIAAA